MHVSEGRFDFKYHLEINSIMDIAGQNDLFIASSELEFCILFHLLNQILFSYRLCIINLSMVHWTQLTVFKGFQRKKKHVESEKSHLSYPKQEKKHRSNDFLYPWYWLATVSAAVVLLCKQHLQA